MAYTQAFSQLYPTQYRPSGLNWQQLKTPHFRIVFPAGEDSLAWQSGRILEQQYGKVQKLTGGELHDFPVILNNYSDLSNGMVTSLHFRSEIKTAPIKGKSMNPRSGNWLETVVPHELVHAMHFNQTGDFGIGWLVRLLSPDLARSLHGAIPAGITEGLAVHHETEDVMDGGGRGDYPFFYNRFNTMFNSERRWTLGQMVHFPRYSRPFDRHYIGGYEFTSWLHRTYGSRTTRDALDFYIDLPFLGYGAALKHVTGKWPSQLYKQFRSDKAEALGGTPVPRAEGGTLPLPHEGASIRKPGWLDDSTLVFYGSFYNARPGFYTYRLSDHTIKLLKATGTVRDYHYGLSGDNRLAYAYYRADPLYDDAFTAELVEISLGGQSTEKLSRGARLYAPTYSDGRLLALQSTGMSSRLVEYRAETGEIRELARLPGRIVDLAVHPSRPDSVALIINKRGLQGLWLANLERLPESLNKPPAISFIGGSVFDPSWHPGGERLLFTADVGRAMNIYEYDLSAGTVKRLSRSVYNVFEASYSPDGEKIAYVRQHLNRQLPVVRLRNHFSGEEVSPSLWKPSIQKERIIQRPVSGSSIDTPQGGWGISDYRTGLSWLRPRTVFPVFEEVSNRDVYEVGLSIQSGSLLQNQSYKLETTVVQNQPWFDLQYRNKTFYPGFKLRAFRRPSFFSADISRSGLLRRETFLLERTGATLSTPLQIDLERNVFNTSLAVEPKISIRRFHALGLGGASVSNRVTLPLAGLFSSFSYRLQQNIRDLQPNSGLYLFGDYEQYLASGQMFLQGLRDPLLFNNLPYRLEGGIYSFLSPDRSLNQSMRLGLLFLKRSDRVFDNQFLVSNGFSEPVFPLANDLASFSLRYTIPLFYPGNGGLLLPFYLSSVYLVGFSGTVSNYTAGNPFEISRTVIGGGIRTRFRLSNLAIDIGIGFGYEPARNNSNFFIGNF